MGNTKSSSKYPAQFLNEEEQTFIEKGKQDIKVFQWDKKFQSNTIKITKKCSTIIKTNHNNTTETVKGKVGFIDGFHIFKVFWPKSKRGKLSVIGLCSKKISKTCEGLVPFCGNQAFSFGWDIVNNKAYRDGILVKDYPLCEHDNYTVPDEFYMIFDLKKGCLSFIADGKCLGICLSNIRTFMDDKVLLYPTACLTASQSEVAIEYKNMSAKNLLLIMDYFSTYESFDEKYNKERKNSSIEFANSKEDSTRIDHKENACFLDVKVQKYFEKYLKFPDNILDLEKNLCYCKHCLNEREESRYEIFGLPPKIIGMPVGWYKFGIKYPDLGEQEELKWYKAYHGLSTMEINCLIKNTKNILNFCTEEQSYPNLNIKTLSPSIKFIDMIAEPIRLNNYSARIAYEVLIEPNSFKMERISVKNRIEKRIPNENLDWRVKNSPKLFVTGILITIKQH